MKKFLLSTLAIVLVTVTTKAQSFALGAKLGANLTKIDGQSFNDGYKLSFQAGAFVELDFGKKLGIQPELLFSQTTSKTVQGTAAIGQGLKENTDFKLNYLSIPVLLRYNVSKLVTIHVGPQFGILMNKDESVTTNGQNAFKSGDLSAVAGLQLNLSSFRIYGRYNVGLSNINDVTSSDKWKSQQIQVGVGLKLL